MEAGENCVLKVLSQSARTSTADVAKMCGMNEGQAESAIAGLENRGIIRGYRAVVDWERSGLDLVYALIEVSLSLSREMGYDAVARDWEPPYVFRMLSQIVSAASVFSSLVSQAAAVSQNARPCGSSAHSWA